MVESSIPSIDGGSSVFINIRPKAGLDAAAAAYTATATISGGNDIIALLSLSIKITGAQYVITQPEPGNLYKYTATKGTLGFSSTGEISDVLSAIRQDANEGAAIIQFGNGEEISIASAIIFENTSSAADKNWGPVEIKGKIFSTNDDSVFGSVVVEDPVSLTSYADIRGEGGGDSNVIYSKTAGAVVIEDGTLTAKFGRVITNKASGTVKVVNGTVAALVKEAILNDGAGDVIVEGGSVTATTGRAILNNSTGTVTVTGGTVKALGNSGVAIKNDSSGKIVVEGGLITSENTVQDQGTIVLATYSYLPATEDDPEVDELLVINDGTVENTINQGRAIYNDTTGKITIAGGSVESTKSDKLSVAIFNKKKGPLDITGGTVKAADGTAITNASTGVITISGGEVSAGTGRAIESQASAERSTAELDKLVIFVTGGKVTSRNPLDTQGTIHLSGAGGTDTTTNTFKHLEISDTAIVENTSATGNAVSNASADNIYVKGGTVTALGGIAIDNRAAEGRLYISGGTVSAINGNAVYNREAVTMTNASSVTISGGTVSAVDGVAVYNVKNGIITITGGIITSENTKSSMGTIFLEAYANAALRLNVKGGVISNTSDLGNGIYNSSNGRVDIVGNDEDLDTDPPVEESRPKVQVTGGAAVYNNGNANLNIRNGAEIIATSGYGVYNKATGASSQIVNITDIPREVPEAEYITTTTKVSATSGSAVYTEAGPVTINGAIISVQSGYAVNKAGTGVVTITTTNGDNRTWTTVRATSGVAINNTATGTAGTAAAAEVQIINKPLITSQNRTLNQGTIIVADSSSQAFNLRRQDREQWRRGSDIQPFLG